VPTTGTPPAAPATGTTPSTTPGSHGTDHPPRHGTGSDEEIERGEHFHLVGEGEQRQRQWVAEQNQTVGQNFSSLGRTLVGDLFHQETEILGSVLGFSDEFHESIDHQADADLGIAAADYESPADRRARVEAERAERSARTSGSATATAHAAPTGAGTATHGSSDAHGATESGAAHDAVAQIARDAYALEELALRIYPNIRSRLRQELLIDRERAGLLTDLR
jgi:hypothetical protein